MICISSSLKKMILIAIFATVPLTLASASAQDKAQINVPFAFVANHASLPAGHYKVLASDYSLTFINADTGRAQAILLARHEQGEPIPGHGSMTFYVIGHRYVLKQVQFGGSGKRSVMLGQPKRERLTAASTERNENAIEIAMN